ncbi:transcriptional regulator [Micromonospora sp. 15K316]|uniref:MmyB family transcriptional regulator n=1 Tax=Micromonospora sp. 15K316 TaxID=2530376 RepID=UPI00104E9D74|nr:helix-turn-helix domain-containing protein [Micromonospora sp. 15K316]TDC24683.1 transcriptional regulator [Micromonospora sp. 15K316]
MRPGDPIGAAGPARRRAGRPRSPGQPASPSTYLIRLEQGRASHPSAQIVAALARALRLADPERAHLRRLAGLAQPGQETMPTTINPSVQRLLDRLTGTPVPVHDASWTLLEANRLIAELRAKSTRFGELWDAGAVGRHEAARKTVEHPRVGTLTLDCDVLTVAGSGLRIMVYSAAPGTEDAERLALLTVLGTRSLGG